LGLYSDMSARSSSAPSKAMADGVVEGRHRRQVVGEIIREPSMRQAVPRDQDSTTSQCKSMRDDVIGLDLQTYDQEVDSKWHMSAEEVAKLQAAKARTSASAGIRLSARQRRGLERQGRPCLGLRWRPDSLGRLKTLEKRGQGIF